MATLRSTIGTALLARRSLDDRAWHHRVTLVGLVLLDAVPIGALAATPPQDDRNEREQSIPSHQRTAISLRMIARSSRDRLR